MAFFKRKKDKDADPGEGVIARVDVDEEIDADAVMRKYDKESNTRIWEGIPKVVVTAFMVVFSVYCLLMTLLSTEQAEARLARFLAFVIVIGFIMYPARKSNHKVNNIPWYDIVLMLLGFGSFIYFAFNVTDILMMGARIEPFHVVLGIAGLPIIIVVACLVIYALYWQLSTSNNPEFYTALRKVVQKLFYTTSGVIGTPINVCYTYIVLFVIFGAFLERTGIANFFIALANKVAGWSSGGAAKVAVIASALCGMVSGSSVGNPMMKKVGYKPEFAGAVEAAASSGGQIMPPIMGAAAFLMAEYIGIPYMEVATKAIVPALLYFAGIFIAVHLEAKKLGLRGIPRKDLPKGSYLLKNCYLIIPLVLLVWIVTTGTRTMAVSAAISIAAAFVVGFINFLTINWSEREEGATFGSVFAETVKIALLTMADAFAAGAKSTIPVAVACGMAGIIAGCITVTGLASTIINIVVQLAGDWIIIGLVFTMICCLILGMGVPTTANYCIMASTCAPILIQLGINPICAHFFVFYFGIAADITPPVALAAYAASAIAKSRPMMTAVNATKLGIGKFVVPYIFAFSPVLLLVGDDVQLPMVIWNTFTATIGIMGLQCALTNTLFDRHINPVFRILFALGGLGMMIPGPSTDLMGFVLIVIVGGAQFFIARKKGKTVHGWKESDDEALEAAQEAPAQLTAESPETAAATAAVAAVATAAAPSEPAKVSASESADAGDGKPSA